MRPFYRFCRFLCQWVGVLYFKARFFGLHHIPRDGGLLLICNHQSFMDPVLSMIAVPREGYFMARDTLFKNPFFGRLIASVNAFPVRRNEADIGAIKESLRRLKQGKIIVLFPEGTRTLDGRIGPMLPGGAAIAKKARVPIVPTLIDGVFQCWPRHRKLPRPGNVIVEYGQAIPPEEYANLCPEELMDLVRNRLVAMQQRWHQRRLPGDPNPNGVAS